MPVPILVLDTLLLRMDWAFRSQQYTSTLRRNRLQKNDQGQGQTDMGFIQRTRIVEVEGGLSCGKADIHHHHQQLIFSTHHHHHHQQLHHHYQNLIGLCTIIISMFFIHHHNMQITLGRLIT